MLALIFAVVALQSATPQIASAASLSARESLAISNGVYCIVLEPADWVSANETMPDVKQSAAGLANPFVDYRGTIVRSIGSLGSEGAAERPSEGLNAKKIAELRRAWQGIASANDALAAALGATPLQRGKAIRRGLCRLKQSFDAGLFLEDPRVPSSALLVSAITSDQASGQSLKQAMVAFDEAAGMMKARHLAETSALFPDSPHGEESWHRQRARELRGAAQRAAQWHDLNDRLLLSVRDLADRVGATEPCLRWRADCFRARTTGVFAPVDIIEVVLSNGSTETVRSGEEFQLALRRCLERRDRAMESLSKAYFESGIKLAERGSAPESAAVAVQRLEKACDYWEQAERESASELKDRLSPGDLAGRRAIEAHLQNLNSLGWNYWRLVCDVRKALIARSAPSD